MSKHIEVSIKLKPETMERISEITAYCKFRQEYTKKDLPLCQEDVIKAAIDEYLRKIDTLCQSVINHTLYNLKESQPLKNKIKLLLDDQGLTQKEFSELTGINQGSLSHILSNRNQPSMEYFLKIWIVLGCPPIEHMFYRESQ